MNGEANCILEICCPPGSQNSRQAFAREAAHATGIDVEYCEKFAAYVFNSYDLAPKGSLGVFKAEVARLAREGYVKA